MEIADEITRKQQANRAWPPLKEVSVKELRGRTAKDTTNHRLEDLYHTYVAPGPREAAEDLFEIMLSDQDKLTRLQALDTVLSMQHIERRRISLLINALETAIGRLDAKKTTN